MQHARTDVGYRNIGRHRTGRAAATMERQCCTQISQKEAGAGRSQNGCCVGVGVGALGWIRWTSAAVVVAVVVGRREAGGRLMIAKNKNKNKNLAAKSREIQASRLTDRLPGTGGAEDGRIARDVCLFRPLTGLDSSPPRSESTPTPGLAAASPLLEKPRSLSTTWPTSSLLRQRHGFSVQFFCFWRRSTERRWPRRKRSVRKERGNRRGPVADPLCLSRPMLHAVLTGLG